MKKIFLILILSATLFSCRDFAMDRCMDSKIEEGMSASEARQECREARDDSRIRR